MRASASRRRLVTFGLSGLCVALAVLAFLPPPAAAPREVPGQISVASLDDGDGQEPVIEARTARGPAFERPIFVPSRRLPAESGTGRASPVQGLKLKAVFLGPEARKALVTTGGARDGQWLSQGEMFDGWRVEAIEPERLVLTGPGGKREVALEKPEAAPPGRRAPKPGRARKSRPADPQERGVQDAPDKESATSGPEPD